MEVNCLRCIYLHMDLHLYMTVIEAVQKFLSSSSLLCSSWLRTVSSSLFSLAARRMAFDLVINASLCCFSALSAVIRIFCQWTNVCLNCQLPLFKTGYFIIKSLSFATWCLCLLFLFLIFKVSGILMTSSWTGHQQLSTRHSNIQNTTKCVNRITHYRTCCYSLPMW